MSPFGLTNFIKTFLSENIRYNLTMSKVQPSFPSKVISFFNSVVQELKKVKWPTRQQVFTLTGIVIAFVLIIGAMLGLFDYIFSTFVNWFIQR